MNAEEENYQQILVNDEKDSDEALIAGDESAGEIIEEVEAEPVKKAKGKKSKKKNKKVVNYENSESEHEEVEESKVEEVPVVEAESTLLVKSDEDEDWSSNKKAKKTRTKGKPKSEKSKPLEPEPIKEEVVEVEIPSSEKFLDIDESDQHRCATCKQIFPSNNKLFTHLKKTNHSIYLGEEKAQGGEKPSSRKKK